MNGTAISTVQPPSSSLTADCHTALGVAAAAVIAEDASDERAGDEQLEPAVAQQHEARGGACQPQTKGDEKSDVKRRATAQKAGFADGLDQIRIAARGRGSAGCAGCAGCAGITR